MWSTEAATTIHIDINCVMCATPTIFTLHKVCNLNGRNVRYSEIVNTHIYDFTHTHTHAAGSHIDWCGDKQINIHAIRVQQMKSGKTHNN